MDKAPAFQFYPSDWLDVKVLRMSLAAQGAYIRWLCHMWRDSSDQCSIESSTSVLSRLIGVSEAECSSILREIQWPNDPVFEEKDGRFVSKRLQRIKKEQDAFRRAKSEAGKKGAAKTWQGHRQSDGTAIDSPMAKNGSSSSSSPSSSKEEIAPAARAICERLVDDLWNVGKPERERIMVTAKRVAKVNARLKNGFTEQDMRLAVSNCLKSEFHQGVNDRGWRAPGPEWVLHTIERLEEWKNKAPATAFAEKRDAFPKF